MKYIIDNSVNKQIAGSFAISSTRVVKLKLTVSKEPDEFFFKVLIHLNAKKNTQIEINGEHINLKNFENNIKEKAPNWKYNVRVKTCIRLENDEYIGLYYIWDLINASKSIESEYNLYFNNKNDYECIFSPIKSMISKKNMILNVFSNLLNSNIDNGNLKNFENYILNLLKKKKN